MTQFKRPSRFTKWILRLVLLSPVIILTLINVLVPRMEVGDDELLEKLKSANIDMEQLRLEYIEYRGEDLRFIQYGDSTKPLLLLIHGSPGDLSGFELYFKDEKLRSNFQLLAYDRPGFGKSTAQARADLNDQYEALQLVLDQVAYRDLYLLGHSYGGAIVWSAFLQPLDGLKHSLVVAGSVDPALEPREWWRPVLDHDLVSWTIPRMLQSSNYEIKSLYNELLTLDSIAVPSMNAMTVFQGDEDKLVPAGNADYLANKVKGSKIIWFEEEGHFILWSKEREIADYIIGLL